MEEIMNKFKDFIYDKSDILIALGILLIAALIIGWRLAAIVEYPKEIIDENNNATEYTEETPSDKPEETPSDKPEDKPEDKPAETPTTDVLWDSAGKLTREVTVTFSGYGAYDFVQCAIDAGLLDSTDEYENICSYQGITDTHIISPPSVYTFEVGATKADVVRVIKG